MRATFRATLIGALSAGALSLAAGALSLSAGALSLAAQKPAQQPKAIGPAKVMILGVFHFANPGADVAQFKGIDVLTRQRQQQIENVVGKLAAFAPNKIAVERVSAESDSINAEYQRYRAGTFTLSRSEMHQLGFRLASRLKHQRVYPVDFAESMRIDSVMAYAQAHDAAYAQRFNATIKDVVQQMDKMQRDETIGANLRWMNDATNLLRAQQPYMEMAAVGAGDGFVGASVVGSWYDRNLHIFANIARIAKPGDRILLIIGMGHAPILRELVRSHPAMVLVEALSYLR